VALPLNAPSVATGLI